MFLISVLLDLFVPLFPLYSPGFLAYGFLDFVLLVQKGMFLSFDFRCKCHSQLYECIVFVGQFGGSGRTYTMHFQSAARDYPPTSSIRLLPLFCCEVVYRPLDLLQTLCGF